MTRPCSLAPPLAISLAAALGMTIYSNTATAQVGWGSREYRAEMPLPTPTVNKMSAHQIHPPGHGEGIAHRTN